MRQAKRDYYDVLKVIDSVKDTIFDAFKEKKELFCWDSELTLKVMNNNEVKDN
mgnify:CR=1 FL=1